MTEMQTKIYFSDVGGEFMKHTAHTGIAKASKVHVDRCFHRLVVPNSGGGASVLVEHQNRTIRTTFSLLMPEKEPTRVCWLGVQAFKRHRIGDSV